MRLSSTTLSTWLARALSIAGHPLAVIPLTIAATTRNWLWTALVAATTTLPLVLLISRNVRRGRWSDFDVSRRDQRLGLYRAGIPLLLLAAALLLLAGASPRMLRALLAAALLLASGALGHRFLKISMHMMFAAFCAVILVRFHPATAAAVVAFLLLVGWSRLHLGRHTRTEVAVGTLLGVAAGALAVF
ncbi:MAG TPA: hypothetical protein VFO89_11725 [Thermoanaerobaculia bacterium]|nr:hypothetical protein [Thermoanaerobaculia bacterium]